MTNLRKSVLPAFSSSPASSGGQENPGPSPSPEATPSVPAQGSGAGPAEVLFQPTEAQSRIRAKFWARVADNPLLDVQALTLAQAQQLTQSAALATWWAKPGFREWFLSATVVDERLDYLLHLALASAEDILLNTDPKAQSARVQMVKIVAEMTGRLKNSPANGQATSGNALEKKKKAIEALGKEELVKFLQDQGVSVQQVVTLDATK